MKRLFRLAAIVLMTIGTVWFFQGVGLLPGSFMTGQRRWAVNGTIAAAAGLVMWIASRRRT